jgi:glycosyltransferase involved in cell wall biosynthesis
MNLGGPAHHVAVLSRGLDRRGYETLLVTGRVGAGEEEHEGLETMPLRRIDSLGPEIRPLEDLRALVALIRLMRAFRPAVIHTHTAKAGMLGRLAAMLAASPRPVVVHTFHGHVLRGYFGSAKTRLFREIERGLARVSNRLIGVSEATVDELVEIGVAPRSKFTVVSLGLELEPFLALDLEPGPQLREEIGAAPGDVIFTFTGRLVPIKRADVMLRGLAIAREAGVPARVVVVGDGEQRTRLEALARDLGCADAVDFFGYRTDLTRIAAGSDAALLSSDNEGTPVALIEAAAAGRPAVATDVGGVSDIVVEGAGLLAPAGDPEALATQIGRLAGDVAARRGMGAAAREHVRARYGAPRLLGDIDALYSQLLAARTSAR